MRRGAGGFTLLEVVVALALLGLVLVMLGQGVQAGTRATVTHRRIVQAQLEIVPVERALRRMIERMDPGVYPEPPAVQGSASVLAFTTDLPDAAGGGTMRADVRLEAAGGLLLLWWTPHGRGVPFGPPAAPRRAVLLERVARLELAYATKGEGAVWRSDWTVPELPGLVRLRLVAAPGGRSWPPVIARPLREAAEE